MSSISPIDTVAVIGLGQMGHGIVQEVALSANHSSVIAYEPERVFKDKGQARIDVSLTKLLKKGRITEDDRQRTRNCITYTTDLHALSHVDLIIEAIPERMTLKNSLFRELNDICRPDSIFASNTSALSITEMAEDCDRPDQFVGLHFFNPVRTMKLVEVIHTTQTDSVVLEQVCDWVRGIGKVAVRCGDTPGFIVSRLLLPSLIQAMLMVDRRDASISDIDICIQLGAGHPMGPLHLADYIGLDTIYFVIRDLTQKYPKEPAFAIPSCLKDKVDAGELGRKSGQGFYAWNGDELGQVKKEDPSEVLWEIDTSIV